MSGSREDRADRVRDLAGQSREGDEGELTSKQTPVPVRLRQLTRLATAVFPEQDLYSIYFSLPSKRLEIHQIGISLYKNLGFSQKKFPKIDKAQSRSRPGPVQVQGFWKVGLPPGLLHTIIPPTCSRGLILSGYSPDLLRHIKKDLSEQDSQ